MYEQSKAAKRRFNDGAFHSRYFVGTGLDIGGGPDPLGQYRGIFQGMGEVATWEYTDGDAQYMAGVPDASYDFLHASHCLEHMRDPREALANWIRVLRPGGFLIVTVPDEDLYEHGLWPSPFNSDHKWSFTLCKAGASMPSSINMVDLAKQLCADVELERLLLVRDSFREHLGAADQTMTPVAECAIEAIWRKRGGGAR